MKYLKLFESFDKTKEDIKDICIDLEDNYFKIEFSEGPINSYVTIHKPNSKNGFQDFTYEEISETLKRIKDYLGDRWIDDNLSASSSPFGQTGDDDDTKIVIVEVEYTSDNMRSFLESNIHIKEEVDDILLELYDKGFDFKNDILIDDPDYDMPDKEIYRISISKMRDGKLTNYNYSEVEEVVNRLVRYLGKRILCKEMMNTSWISFRPKKDGDTTGIGLIEITYYI